MMGLDLMVKSLLPALGIKPEQIGQLADLLSGGLGQMLKNGRMHTKRLTRVENLLIEIAAKLDVPVPPISEDDDNDDQHDDGYSGNVVAGNGGGGDNLAGGVRSNTGDDVRTDGVAGG